MKETSKIKLHIDHLELSSVLVFGTPTESRCEIPFACVQVMLLILKLVVLES